MDTSEIYIKMCDKAEEIQLLFDERNFDNGSFWYRGDKKGVVTNKGFAFHRYFLKLGDVWLPRQDQLQEMTKDTIGKYPNLAVIDRLVLFKEMIFRENIFFSSWEQFWLGFVMQQKYSKIWNGEDWIQKQ